ncbi:cytochrome d ubiquinol oxidase subunit II [Massilia antarctica]|uniref:cytochrome d ubiquinol oxidase subunit II n=1 Tax=Massilia antarctica TaxID=2765360 RepID=UPI0006BB8B11|nr:cytochrome d ubiquinol oxidase subunit II [Massilia sp. H27-R4]MCY0914752.1 cytochrome d ubiquinol oxidase subunit II [Massilia sp. H27-R4]CUI08211.1 Cytochrome d ubiquinol oxidase subunit II [Janthinobacterium sp. CG23_2]CUU31997.1 Cytochrome d ubiquinol oxidase subunit II [Janthinobacterium sp. CG23_2]
MCWGGIRDGRGVPAFAAAVGLFLLAMAGLVLSNMPYVVPLALTVRQAASHPGPQLFYLIGAAILLPVILAYTVLVFWLFRGKLRVGEGYHA